MALARRTVAHHAIGLSPDRSLQALDDRSLCYLTWRWAYAQPGIPVDEA